jgi:hypothetical protein
VALMAPDRSCSPSSTCTTSAPGSSRSACAWPGSRQGHRPRSAPPRLAEIAAGERRLWLARTR